MTPTLFGSFSVFTKPPRWNGEYQFYMKRQISVLYRPVDSGSIRNGRLVFYIEQ